MRYMLLIYSDEQAWKDGEHASGQTCIAPTSARRTESASIHLLRRRLMKCLPAEDLLASTLPCPCHSSVLEVESQTPNAQRSGPREAVEFHATPAPDLP